MQNRIELLVHYRIGNFSIKNFPIPVIQHLLNRKNQQKTRKSEVGKDLVPKTNVLYPYQAINVKSNTHFYIIIFSMGDER